MSNVLDRFTPWLGRVLLALALLIPACGPKPSGNASPNDPTQNTPPPRGKSKSHGKMTEGKLRGIDSSQLTAREKREWWAHVTESLAPCADQPVSVAQCVHEKRPCAACVPAAEFLMTQVILGKPRKQIETAYALRFDPEGERSVNTVGAPWKGAKDAEVTIVEWADFQCPFCALAAPYLKYLTEAYPDHVKIVFKHFPISYHMYAIPAGRAVVAAHRQGKFWEMHDLLYENRDDLSDPVLLRLAKELGLDVDRFQVDMAAKSTLELIERDQQEGNELGLRGTPMIYINNRHFDLEQFDLLRDLEPWLQLEVELATGKRPRPKVAPPSFMQMNGASPADGDGH